MTSLITFGIFNRKNTPCAILQGGVLLGMFIAASQALVDPKANRWEISSALTTLTLTYGALSEQPYLCSTLLLLLMSAKNRDAVTSSTLSPEFHLGISTLGILGLITPWFRMNENEINSHNNHSLPQGKP